MSDFIGSLSARWMPTDVEASDRGRQASELETTFVLSPVIVRPRSHASVRTATMSEVDDALEPLEDLCTKFATTLPVKQIAGAGSANRPQGATTPSY